MAHTLWSHGTLLGNFDLAVATHQPEARTAPFWPTEAGLALMPAFVDVLTTAMALGPMMRRNGITREKLGDRLGEAVYDALHNSPEGIRAAEARGVVAALDLELHDETGQRVETGQVLLYDIGAVIPGGLPAETSLDGEPPGFSRYLVCVMDPIPGQSPDSR